jgi:hypothetical protein
VHDPFPRSPQGHESRGGSAARRRQNSGGIKAKILQQPEKCISESENRSKRHVRATPNQPEGFPVPIALDAGEPLVDIARTFNVSHSTISRL